MSFALIDIESTTLSAEDRELLQHPCVAGLILFTRNYESPQQLRALTNELRSVRSELLIAVDQEGGRVQRFREGFSELPSQRYWGEYHANNPLEAKVKLQEMTKTLATELKDAGVNLNLAPVLDVDVGISSVIGERSFSSNWEVVVELAEIVVDTVHSLGMPVTAKHFPGHGGVAADSHKALPLDSRQQSDILNSDLRPFSILIKKLDAIMPAHVIYEAFDAQPTTFSSFWLRTVLREQLGFKGLVISDDLTMAGAASIGSYAERAEAASEAGCDLLSVCNDRAGAIEVLNILEHADGKETELRLQHFIQHYTVTN